MDSSRDQYLIENGTPLQNIPDSQKYSENSSPLRQGPPPNGNQQYPPNQGYAPNQGYPQNQGYQPNQGFNPGPNQGGYPNPNQGGYPPNQGGFQPGPYGPPPPPPPQTDVLINFPTVIHPHHRTCYFIQLNTKF